MTKEIVDMTKAEFNKVKKYLKTKIPHHRFILENKNVKAKLGSRISENYFSIDATNLFEIVNELMDKKK